ncbi:Stage V sporulation protein K [Rubripirellula obstinata]|uniref:Stage V sporulation protein K n=1 Tax=Rubripirellula obstinata TaxID=406547 RepID=A0A5B1CRI7_9BACT|nr:AAA family ATPase [Rubripirellula obstinata]KAA1262585.1 Stage V sporulation protein K [Rubripirellula obstinata]
MNHDKDARLIGMLRRVVRDCGKLYATSAKLMVRRYPTEIEGLPQRFAELMDDLHRGLIIKIYVTIVRADDRWTAPEKRVAAAIIEHLWDQKLTGNDLREAATGLFEQADALDWESLVAPFVRYKPLVGSKAQVETVVLRLANLVAKCDGQTMPEEQMALHALQKEIDAALHPATPEKTLAPLTRGKHATAADREQQHAESESRSKHDADQTEAMSETDRTKRLAAAIKELDELIGLDQVKRQVKSYTNFLKLQNERREKGLSTMPISLHMAFVGNPGTGKTTVARIIGQILGAMGTLKTGHVVETDRSGLVAEYAGQTATKTNELCDSAMGGVLFIDEAYSLIDSSGDDAYGREAIQALLKRMEDDRDQVAVILAGYSDEMKNLIQSNPGLSSRINTNIEFGDYDPADLGRIFEMMCRQNDYELPAAARHRLLLGFHHLYQKRDRHFGNGRLVRNAFEDSVRRLADRIAGVLELSEELLTQLTVRDISVPGISDDELDRMRNAPHKLRMQCKGCARRIRVQPESLGVMVRCGKCNEVQSADWALVSET